MELTKQQIKKAKQICKANGVNPALVTGKIGNGFWEEKCGGTFEGYLSYLIKPFVSSGNLEAVLMQSKIDYKNGNYGAAKFR